MKGCRVFRARTHACLALAMVLLVAAFWWQGHPAAQQVRDAQVQGCLRVIADRQDAIERDTDISDLAFGTPHVEQRAEDRIRRLEPRARIRCESEFPEPSLWR